MADVSIDSSVVAVTSRGMRSVVFTTESIGYCFYLDSDGIFGYSKTTDGGATWGAQVNVDSTAETTIVAFDVWFDQWTPGDTGTKIHTWFFGVTADDVFYRSLDTNGDTLGTQVTVQAESTSVAGRGAFISGTKTRSGYLYVAYDIDAGAEKELFRSTDAGATWGSTLSSTFIEATLDQCKLFPASGTGDNNDMWAVYYDASATALTLKLWDSSAASAVESATIQTHTDGATDLTGQYGYDASVRHSDGHLILAAVSLRDNASSVHNVYDITDTSTITTKGNITTNIDDHYYPQVFIDQATNAIYVAYNGKRDGSEVMDTLTKVYYTTSTDGGTSWTSGDTAYMENATGAAVQQVWTPLMGPRFYAGWRVGTTLLGNKVSSVVMAIYTTPSETLHISETAAPKINLGPVSLTETLHVTDIGGGTIQVFGRIRSIDTIADRALTSGNLTQTLSETLHIADTVTSQMTLGTVGLSETLHIADTVTPLMGGLTQTLSETLHVADTVTAFVSPLAAILAETLHIADTVTPLMGGLATELSETLHLADTVVATRLSPLVVSLSETLHVADVAIATMGGLATVMAETLHLADAGEIQVLGRILVIDTDLTAVRQEPGSLSISLSETLHLADAVDSWVALDDPEVLHIVETLTVAMQLATSLTETLHLADTVTATMGGLSVSLSETLHLTDTVTSQTTLGNVSLSETLHVTETVSAVRLSPLQVTLSETLHLSDAGVGVVLGALVYYVDATGGSDAAAGTSTGTAWQTISKVNSSSFNPGDSILFKKGETWRERLTVPSSGSTGQPISIGAYGSGANPILTGTALITGFALTAGDGVWTSAAQTGAVQGTDTSTVVENWRIVIQAAQISTGGTSIRLLFNGHPTDSSVLQKLTIGQQHATNPEDFASAPTSLKFGGSDISVANPLTIPAGGFVATDFTTFTLDETLTYLVHFWNGSAFQGVSRWLAGSTQSYYNTSATDFSATQDYAGTPYNGIYLLAEIQVPSVETEVWAAACPVTPLVVSFDGVAGQVQASAAALAAPGDWYHAAGTLYVYSTTDPDTTWTAPGIEASARDRVMEIIGKSFITLADLDLHGSNAFVLNFDNADDVTASRLTVFNAGSSGVNIENGSSNVTLSGCVVRDNGHGIGDRNGIGIGGLGNGSSNTTVVDCDVYGNVNHNLEVASTDTDAVMSGVIVTRSRFRDGLKGGIQIGGGHTGVVLTYNLIAANAQTGVIINKGTVSGNPVTTLYGNVIWGNGTAGTTNLNHGVAYSPDGNTQTLKNNIIGQSNGFEIEKGSGATLVSDTNLWYHSAGGTFMRYHGSSYSFANWQINSGLDAASVNADPLFTNAGAQNFTLQTGSPAINAGANLGAAYDDALDPASVWPSGVATLDQDLYGTDWEIGAYVFEPGLTVVLSETLHVTETLTARLSPLVTVAAETLHLSDTVTARMTLGDLSLSETLHISDVVTSELSPLLVSLTETLHLADVVVAVVSPLQASLTETVHVTDTLMVTMGDLVTGIAETLHVADVVTSGLTPLLVSPSETLHLIDTATTRMTLGDVSLSETLRVADTVVDARLSPLLVSLSETLHVSDTLIATMGDLATAISETLHVTDAVAAALSRLEVSVTETLHIADVVTSQITLGDVSLSETLHLTDGVTLQLTPLQASLTETLHVTDTLMATMGDLATVIAEILHVTDGVTSTGLTPLLVSPSETLHVTDSVAIVLDLQTVLSETLHLADGVVAVVLSPLQATLTETLHGADSTPSAALAAEGTLATSLTETLHVVETVAAFVAPLLAQPSETLHVTDVVAVAMHLSVSPTETLHIVETVTASLELSVTLAETVHCADTITTAALSSFDVTVAETLHISEVVTAGIDVFSLILSESITLSDQEIHAQLLGPATPAETISFIIVPSWPQTIVVPAWPDTIIVP